jgi:hypothetical protein
LIFFGRGEDNLEILSILCRCDKSTRIFAFKIFQGEESYLDSLKLKKVKKLAVKK